MLKTLLRKQMTEIFRSYFYNAKKNKARSKAATAGYIIFFVLLMAGLCGGAFTFLSFMLCPALAGAGLGWMYYALMGLLAVLLGAFGSVFNTYSGLYLSKDNDLLLSMPIPVRTIMTARLLGVYLMGLMYSGVVSVPAAAVYLAVAGFSVPALIGALLFVLLLSIFVLTLSCTLGWVVAKISLKLKNKSFITVFISLVFFGAYYFFYYRAQSLISELLANAEHYGALIRGRAYPLYLFGRMGQGDWLAVLIVTAAVLLLFGLVWYLMSRSFIGIATASGKKAKAVYRAREEKRKSAASALLGKELRRFTGSPAYMLNCGMGVLMLPVCGILLLVKGDMLADTVDSALRAYPGAMAALACAVLTMAVSMNDMTAPSVSLEGKSLWLLKSLPVTPWQVLRAKLCMQLLLTAIPLIFAAVCAAAVLRGGVMLTALVILLPLLTAVLLAELGLTLGLKMPNLTWTAEITPIKQSASVAVSLLGGWVYGLLMGGGFFLLGKHVTVEAYLLAFSALTLVLCALLYLWLKERGTRMLEEL